jgi:hypothetical protein
MDMKKITLMVPVLLISATIALADWKTDFAAEYAANGLQQAVSKALSQGVNPDDIALVAVQIQDLDTETIATAMCEAGIDVPIRENLLKILHMPLLTAVRACGGNQMDNISAGGAFPGSNYNSARKPTTSTGSGEILPPKPPPASGSTF